MPLLYLLFLLSGTSGLIYQIVWVRQFSNVFGSTVYSASLVTGIFMLGLGFGSYFAGHWTDRQHRGDSTKPLRAYGFFEIAIALLGLALAWVLPNLEAFSASITSYHPSAEGWFEPSVGSSAARYVIAILLLAPITALMGGTLTLLVRHLIADDLGNSGWRVGLLYAANTAGAALGCLLTDFSLIPTLGLFSTQGVAVLLNLLAGLGALRLSQRHADSQREARVLVPSEQRGGAADQPRFQREVVFVSAAIFASGFAGMAMEIVWFRHLISVLGGYRGVFSILLFVILTGVWLGSLAGGYWHRRLGRPGLGYALAQAAFVCSALLLLAGLDRGEVVAYVSTAFSTAPHGSEATQRSLGFWTSLRVAAFTIGPPSVCMGAAYPLANALVQRVDSSVGRRAGALYLANTCGAVLGAIVAGFVLLPTVGTQLSALIGMSGAVLAIPLLSAAEPPKGTWARLVLLGAVLAGSFGLVAWLRLPSNRLVSQTVSVAPGDSLVEVSEGVSETIAVIDNRWGRILATNGHNMSANTPAAQRYMRAFVHIPLMHVEAPTDALIVCFGVGTTLHAASLHGELERIEVVDISRHILEHAPYFEASSHGVLRDPRVRVFVNDGRQHLRAQPAGRYDLITAEPPPIAHAGVAALYSVEYYELVRSRLKTGGLVSQWLPAYQQTATVVREMIKAFVQVFPNAILLSGVEKELILMGRKDAPLEISPDQIERMLAENPALRSDLARITMGDSIEILGTFVADAETLANLTKHDLAVTDDYPSMEYSRYGSIMNVRLPEGLFAVQNVGRWCPTCVAANSPLREPLLAYLSVRDRIYRTERFMSTGSTTRAETSLKLTKGSPEMAAIARSAYLQAVLGGAGTSSTAVQYVAP